jgi:hypothetical protein
MTLKKKPPREPHVHHVRPRRHGNHGARIRPRAYPQWLLNGDFIPEDRESLMYDHKYGVRGSMQGKPAEDIGRPRAGR